MPAKRSSDKAGSTAAQWTDPNSTSFAVKCCKQQGEDQALVASTLLINAGC